MRLARPVLFSLALSLLLAPGSSSATGAEPVTDIEVEPGGPLGAGATLVKVNDEGGQPRALVRLDLISSGTDAEATITALTEAREPAGELARASLGKGRPLMLLLETGLQAGRENHLFYRVEARGRDGSRAETIVYLRVNLDPGLEPREVEGCLEYEGAPSEEVR